MALPASVPDTQLGLSASEIATFRHHQSIALAAAPSVSSHYGTSSNHSRTPSTAYSYTSNSTGRGRGVQRGSNPSSRAASAASSAGGGQGRLLLDAGSLSVLGAYFERLMVRIQERVDYVSASQLFLDAE